MIYDCKVSMFKGKNYEWWRRSNEQSSNTKEWTGSENEHKLMMC